MNKSELEFYEKGQKDTLDSIEYSMSGIINIDREFMETIIVSLRKKLNSVDKFKGKDLTTKRFCEACQMIKNGVKINSRMKHTCGK